VKPIVLVATTSLWFPTARLAMALTRAGFTVEAVCPPHHPLSKISAVRRTYKYRRLFPLLSLESAITGAQADLVIPGDDLAARHLHLLHARERNRGSEGAKICSLIEGSLGSAESFSVVYQRATFMRLAEEEGVRVPKTTVIESVEDLQRGTAATGFPTVLKADGTSGGDGVRMARNLEEAANVHRGLEAPPLLARAAKRALIDRDPTLIGPSLLRRRSSVSAQTMIIGHEATSTVACWKGTVLAGLHFEVVNKKYAAGPATVMRLIENAEMTNAIEKMVRRLNLSGIHGFDFMLEAHTGNAYLIEINPRATQVGHLSLGPGHDLPAALAAAVTGSHIQHAPKVTEKDTVALFPQEWTRDPASSFIQSGYHDVPWEEPWLVEACMRHALKQSKSRSMQSRQAAAHQRTADLALIKAELNESRHE
jgi:Carbamoyl-phosphate synthase L chain, ATP binding domain